MLRFKRRRHPGRFSLGFTFGGPHIFDWSMPFVNIHVASTRRRREEKRIKEEKQGNKKNIERGTKHIYGTSEQHLQRREQKEAPPRPSREWTHEYNRLTVGEMLRMTPHIRKIPPKYFDIYERWDTRMQELRNYAAEAGFQPFDINPWWVQDIIARHRDEYDKLYKENIQKQIEQALREVKSKYGNRVVVKNFNDVNEEVNYCRQNPDAVIFNTQGHYYRVCSEFLKGVYGGGIHFYNVNSHIADKEAAVALLKKYKKELEKKMEEEKYRYLLIGFAPPKRVYVPGKGLVWALDLGFTGSGFLKANNASLDKLLYYLKKFNNIDTVIIGNDVYTLKNGKVVKVNTNPWP